MIYGEETGIPGTTPLVAECKTVEEAQFIVTACNSHHEIVRALSRLVVGISQESTADCEYYYRLEGDALDEARTILAKLPSEK